MLFPSYYTQGVEPVPNDVNFKPNCAVIGLPKSGKSKICQTLNELTQMVHLQPEQIIQDFIDRQFVLGDQVRDNMKN